MWFLYLDEIGHIGAYDAARPNQGSPIFGLGGVALQAQSVRKLIRPFNDLKARYFRNEFARHQAEAQRLAALDGQIKSGAVRDAEIERVFREDRRKLGVAELPVAQWDRIERFEVQGSSLASAGTLNGASKNMRNVRFGQEVLRNLLHAQAKVFARIHVKRSTVHQNAIYGRLAQGLIQDFYDFLEKEDDVGVAVIDERNRGQNSEFLQSVQSYCTTQGLFERILETPFPVDSRWFSGVQIADLVNGILGGLYRWRAAGAVLNRAADLHYGSLIDQLTWTRGTWRSVYVIVPPSPSPAADTADTSP